LKIKQFVSLLKTELNTISPNPRLEAQFLLKHFLKYSSADLVIKGETKIPKQIFSKLLTALEQRKQDYPLAYILGSHEFFGREFVVNENVLIPRPETEELVDYVLNKVIDQSNKNKLLDLGTGSGCIAITCKLEQVNLEVWAADISEDALKIAKKNAELLKSPVNFVKSDLLLNSQISQCFWSVIIANLPYVRTNVKTPELQYEPALALFSGTEGLDHYRNLAKQVSAKNCQNLVLEIDDQQADLIPKIFPQSKQIKIIKDLNNKKRIAHLRF
jgi:release factor glutamine methyltransferase